MLFLGIDGGGTKTRFLLQNEAGATRADVRRDTIHYMTVGFERVTDVLNDGLQAALAQAGGRIADVAAACIGIPGYGEIVADRDALRAAVQARFPIPDPLLCNDVRLGWAGALAARPGICIVAGTGSMAWGVDESGNEARSGGWGFQLGDEGSAYWIGMSLLRAFTHQSDGRAEKTMLHADLRDRLDLRNDFDLLDHVVHRLGMRRGEIALFALDAARLAQAGDPAAIRIFERAADELALHAKAVAARLPFAGDIRVSWSGGVFQAGELILAPLRTGIAAWGMTPSEPLMDPAAGACLLAARHAGAGLEPREGASSGPCETASPDKQTGANPGRPK